MTLNFSYYTKLCLFRPGLDDRTHREIRDTKVGMI